MRRDLFVAFGVFAVSLAIFVIVTVVVGTLALGILDTGERPRLSITAVFVGCMALGIFLYVLLERASDGRVPIVAAIAALGWFPVLVAIGDHELGNAMVEGPTSSASYLGLGALVTIAFPVVAAIAASSIANLVRTGNVLRVIAPAAWVAGAVLVGIAGWRLSRLPDPDTYGASFLRRHTLAVHESMTLDAKVIRFEDPMIDYGRCFFQEKDQPWQRFTTDTLPCTGVDLFRDDTNGFWIVRQRGKKTGGDAALRFGSLEQLTVFPRTIPKSIAPPVGWAIGAAGGLLLAFAALVGAFAFHRRGLAMRAAGVHLGALAITALSCATLLASAAHFLLPL